MLDCGAQKMIHCKWETDIINILRTKLTQWATESTNCAQKSIPGHMTLFLSRDPHIKCPQMFSYWWDSYKQILVCWRCSSMLLLLSVSLLIILLSIAPLIFQGAITAITEAIIANGIAANMAYAAPVVLYFIITIFTSVIFSCDKEKKGYLMLFNALFWLMSSFEAIIRFFSFSAFVSDKAERIELFFISESSQRKRIYMKIIQIGEMSKLRICFFASCSKICTSLPPLHRNGENWSSEENAGEEVMKFTFEQIQPSRKTYLPMFFSLRNYC